MNKLSVLVSIVAGLGGGVVGFGVASYSVGRQLAVLDEIRPALERLQVHETRLAVIAATCCGERTSTQGPTPLHGLAPWLVPTAVAAR
jgi:hypothetical protein